MKVFITRVIPEEGLQLLQEAGLQLTQWTEKRDLTPAELIAYCKQHDALLSVGPNKISSSFLQECRHLKVIALHAVGFDNVDVPAATALKIPVGNTPGVLSNATADTAFLLMLAVSRKAFYMHKQIAKGQWGFFEPTANLGIELTGKTLGIAGLGKIGFEMAKRCIGAYGMKVIYHNRHTNREAEEVLKAEKVSFDELLTQSDVLSVHTALTPETQGMFNKAAFDKMKRSAIFINAARGSIHNETDLLNALNEKVIWGAGLDVTNPEPMAADSPLLDLPNVAILPHIGSATVEARDAMAIMAAKNIIAGLKGERLPFVVNPEIY
ncbi:D-glycerate dehydrogenase [Chitinophaga niabensis]|uniref:2-hydroxyacid dehydrogenase n=1 Tax=Chitinophaga niabensis TaxID=536979 RepID=UPI0031BB94BB